ncbi:hypothetical protein ASD23_15395 [Agromyces sp. Root1464]|uniref:hypothetical protein n=1 Tax=Agromyces sp. Root1464 TaxID=1736467 RepID=UPI0006FF1C30|nr:hypothetical protein [Agromyces sp. Root1464]KQZ09586.1 hypothetical protein ASD23_15395 [Agromyces sp. Root1464]
MSAERVGVAFEEDDPAASAHRIDGAAARIQSTAHRTGHRADRAVLAWGRWYTRDLPAEVAADRIAELESDVFEERAAAGDAAGAGRSIVGRAIRGVPADLAWRVARLRGLSLTAPRGTFPLALPALAHVATAMLLAWGVLIVVRVGAGMLDGSWAGARDLVAAGVVGLGLALIGSALSLVPEARWLGSLWLAVASYVLIRFGMYALIATSTTLSAFYTSALAEAILINRVMSAAGVLFFVSMAAWWLPSAKRLWAARPARVHGSAPLDPEGTTA